MCIRDSIGGAFPASGVRAFETGAVERAVAQLAYWETPPLPVSYTHLRAHETVLDIVCRLLLEKKKIYYTKIKLYYYKKKITLNTIANHSHATRNHNQ